MSKLAGVGRVVDDVCGLGPLVVAPLLGGGTAEGETVWVTVTVGALETAEVLLAGSAALSVPGPVPVPQRTPPTTATAAAAAR